MIKKHILTFFLMTLISFISFGQTQIGSDINGQIPGINSGYSISLSADGNVVAIGAPFISANSTFKGKVTVYQNLNGNWLQLGNDINGGPLDGNLGISVSLSSDGSILAIGDSTGQNNDVYTGRAKIYQYQNNNWIQLGNDINGQGNNGSFGSSISLSANGNIAAIGATNVYGSGTASGYVQVYQYQSPDWVQLGDNINGEAQSDNSGYSVSLSSDGSILAIGSINYGSASNSSVGHVRVFQYQNGSWIQLGNNIEGESSGDQSGFSISLSGNGNILAIGSESNTGINGIVSGHVRVYEYQGGNWIQLGGDIDGESLGDQSGTSVSLVSDGSILVIGAKSNDGNGNNSGHARVYKYRNGNWLQIGNDINGEAAFDSFGVSANISADGNVVAIGANRNDDNGDNSGHVRVFDLSEVLSISSYSLSSISLYPNPVKDKVFIDLQSLQEINLKNVVFYNILGQYIFSTKKTNVIDVSNLKAGLYFLSIETSFGKINKRLVVID